jgi:hypothetical protein
MEISGYDKMDNDAFYIIKISFISFTTTNAEES